MVKSCIHIQYSLKPIQYFKCFYKILFSTNVDLFEMVLVIFGVFGLPYLCVYHHNFAGKNTPQNGDISFGASFKKGVNITSVGIYCGYIVTTICCFSGILSHYLATLGVHSSNRRHLTD